MKQALGNETTNPHMLCGAEIGEMSEENEPTAST